MGEVGTFHSPQIHNFINFNHADSARVTSNDAVMFKHFMGSDKSDFLRTKPAYPMYYDTDFNYAKDRDFWLKVIVAMMAGSYLSKRYWVEQDRSRMTARLNGYEGLPGHHFHNRGGVVVMKDFAGFTKYFQNEEQQMDWFKKVYPKTFS